VLEKYLRNDLERYLTLTGFFIFNIFNYAYNTPWRFEWNFGFYVFVFAVGFTACKRNWLRKSRDKKILLVLALISVTVYVVPLPTLNLSTELGRAQYFSYMWIRSTAFSLSSIMILLVALFHLRKTLGSRGRYAVPNFLGSHTLYIYLWEGYVSPRVCGLVFGVSSYYQLWNSSVRLNLGQTCSHLDHCSLLPVVTSEDRSRIWSLAFKSSADSESPLQPADATELAFYMDMMDEDKLCGSEFVTMV
jgi:hypothetical protein